MGILLDIRCVEGGGKGEGSVLPKSEASVDPKLLILWQQIINNSSLCAIPPPEWRKNKMVRTN